MTQERGPGRLGGMSTKQKVTIGALAVVVLIILWQVMGLFGGSKPTAVPVAKKPAVMSATAPGMPAGQHAPGVPGTPTPATMPAAPGNPAVPGNAMPPSAASQPGAMTPEVNIRQAPVSVENKLLETQSQTEEKYVGQLNQLQSLKVEREIAETNQAIAAARLATVTAEKSVSDLLTKPSEPTQPEVSVPPGAYSAALVNPALEGTQVVPPQNPPPPPKPMEITYTVVSVSMQLGKWTAVLGYEGKLYSVSVGDVLPEDKSIVRSINKNGVTLVSKEGKRRKISILTSI